MGQCSQSFTQRDKSIEYLFTNRTNRTNRIRPFLIGYKTDRSKTVGYGTATVRLRYPGSVIVKSVDPARSGSHRLSAGSGRPTQLITPNTSNWTWSCSFTRSLKFLRKFKRSCTILKDLKNLKQITNKILIVFCIFF